MKFPSAQKSMRADRPKEFFGETKSFTGVKEQVGGEATEAWLTSKSPTAVFYWAAIW